MDEHVINTSFILRYYYFDKRLRILVPGTNEYYKINISKDDLFNCPEISELSNLKPSVNDFYLSSKEREKILHDCNNKKSYEISYEIFYDEEQLFYFVFYEINGIKYYLTFSKERLYYWYYLARIRILGSSGKLPKQTVELEDKSKASIISLTSVASEN